MSRKDRSKIDTSGGDSLPLENPFASLSSENLPSVPEKKPPVEATPKKSTPRKGPQPRVEIRRLKQGKGGKTVTEVQGLAFLGERELETLLKKWKARFGVGGTRKGSVLEIQGDQRDAMAEDLQAKGYRVVFVGG